MDVVNEVIDPSQVTDSDEVSGFSDRNRLHDRAPGGARGGSSGEAAISMTTIPPIREAAFPLSLVSDLKKRGIPIDGVGHQMHNIDYPSADSVLRRST